MSRKERLYIIGLVDTIQEFHLQHVVIERMNSFDFVECHTSSYSKGWIFLNFWEYQISNNSG